MPNWAPKDKRNSQLVGGITRGGDLVSGPGMGAPAKRNKLHLSSDPIVRRIGDFCAETTWPSSDMALFGGLLMGLTIANLYPGLVSDLLSSITEGQPNAEASVSMARKIIEGDEPDHRPN